MSKSLDLFGSSPHGRGAARRGPEQGGISKYGTQDRNPGFRSKGNAFAIN